MFFIKVILFIMIGIQTNTFYAQEIADPDKLLKKIIDEISNENLSQAIIDLDKLIKIAPNFNVARIIKSDLIKAKLSAIDDFGSGISNNNFDVESIKLELLKRIKSTDPENFEELNSKYNFLLNKQTQYLIFVDLKKSRMIVFSNKNNKLKLVSDHYISIGKKGFGKIKEGDKKTPVGVYFLKNKIKEKLPDKYGLGAYVLNYPNSFDRLNKNTGYGIWIHGVPTSTFSRPPYSSDGCIVLTNKDISSISDILNIPNTPVIVSDIGIEEMLVRDDNVVYQNNKEIKQKIELWKTTWESGNFRKYLDFYSKEEVYDFKNFELWTNQKRNVFKSSINIKVDIDNLTFFEYPNSKENLLLVKFNQHYSSNLIETKMTKQQLWKKDGDAWKIIFEGKYF